MGWSVIGFIKSTAAPFFGTHWGYLIMSIMKV